MDRPDKEADAVAAWNCGVLANKSARKLKCRAFQAWNGLASKQIGTHCPASGILAGSSSAYSQSLSFPMNYPIEQLKAELEGLIKEQSQLEQQTDAVRARLSELRCKAPIKI